MNQKQPNVLFLYTDQQRADTLAAYGNDAIRMPHLNALAEECLIFRNCYVTQAVCTPSRSTLLTGLWPHTNGCTENNRPLDEATRCFPELVDGYAPEDCGHHGKWHLGDEIYPQHGFGHWRSIDDGYRGYYTANRNPDDRSSYCHWLLEKGYRPRNGTAFDRGEVSRLPEEHSKTAFLGETASAFIRERKDALRPWMLFVNFFEPHSPVSGPRDDQYASDDVEPIENYAAPPTACEHLKSRMLSRHYTAQSHGGHPAGSEVGYRHMKANYWGLCSQVDCHAGRILDALRETGQWDNTLVVFTSDHGDMMGSHQLLFKCVQYEEAVKVPLLIKPATPRAGRQIVEPPVSHIDLMPTLFDLLGQTPPDHLQGTSLLPLVRGEREADEVVVEWNGPNNGLGDMIGTCNLPDSALQIADVETASRAGTDPVRTVVHPEGWKATLSPMGFHEVYDLRIDPGETRNLASESQGRRWLERAREILQAWQSKTRDAIALPQIDPS